MHKKMHSGWVGLNPKDRKYIVDRGDGRLYYSRRVPVHAAEEMGKKKLFLSLKTTDMVMAVKNAAVLTAKLEALWQSLAANGKQGAEDKYKRAVKMARFHGFEYKTANEIAEEGAASVMQRVDALRRGAAKPPGMATHALLGGIQKPQLLLKDCFAAFEDYSSHVLINKNNGQKQRWRVARLGSYNAFLDAVAREKPLTKTTRDDIMLFRDALMKRHLAGEITAHTVNKNLMRVKVVFSTISDHLGLGLAVDGWFYKTKIKEKKKPRPPYDADFVANNLLDRSLFEGMNGEAYLLIPAMSNTGMRPSEVCALRSEDIMLNAAIPHVIIRHKDDGHLKTDTSERTIPLVGASLWAFQQMPQGFTHYYQKSDSATTLVNKILRTRNMQPTAEHSLYSLRHTFQDMLRMAGADERIQCELMGHAYKRPAYGRPTLEEKKAVIEKFAFQMKEN